MKLLDIKDGNPVLQFFRHDGGEEKCYCLVPDCKAKLFEGLHGGNLAKHVKIFHEA